MTRFDIVGSGHHGHHGDGFDIVGRGHHGGGGHRHGGGGRRRFGGGGGWYGPAYGYWDWPYDDGCYDAYGRPIPCERTVIVGRHAQAAEIDAGNVARAIAPLFVAGFWDSVKNAVLTYTGTKATNQFIQDHHLEPYVKMGAKAISTYYGGPAAGKASDYITPMMMSVGVKDKDAAAQTQLAQATQAAAAHSPEAHQAVQIAKDAAQTVATAYHVAQITKDAKAGNAGAMQAMDNLGKAAKGGDTSAAAALLLAQVIHGAQSDDTKGTARDPNWQVDPSQIEIDAPSKTVGVPSSTVDISGDLLIGAAAVTLRDQATRAARQMPGQIIGVILTGDGWGLQAFPSVDDADDWFGWATDIPHDYVYAAYFDKSDPLFLLNESHGTLGQKTAAKGRHAPQIERSIAVASGIPLPLLAALGAGAGLGAGSILWHQRAQRRFDELARAQAAGRQAMGSPSADPLHPNTGPR